MTEFSSSIIVIYPAGRSGASEYLKAANAGFFLASAYGLLRKFAVCDIGNHPE